MYIRKPNSLNLSKQVSWRSWEICANCLINFSRFGQLSILTSRVNFLPSDRLFDTTDQSKRTHFSRSFSAHFCARWQTQREFLQWWTPFANGVFASQKRHEMKAFLENETIPQHDVLLFAKCAAEFRKLYLNRRSSGLTFSCSLVVCLVLELFDVVVDVAFSSATMCTYKFVNCQFR